VKYKIVPVTPFEQNCTLICCEQTKHAAIIDPGGDISRIESAVKKLGMSLQLILITHGHLDHVGAVAELSEQYKLPIVGPHRGDQFWIDTLSEQSKMFNLPSGGIFHPDRWLKHGEKVSIGKIVLDVIHCPGHTPGHVVFYSPKDKLAVVGDVLFAGSIGRTDLPQGNHNDLIRSIRVRLLPLGDDIEFIPGHGPMSSFGQEKHNNPFIKNQFHH
jgi:glyoxylase-like metal-dependent hydrolase (beta-lactamase superfamily II)